MVWKPCGCLWIAACMRRGEPLFSPRMASNLPTADLLALDTDGLKGRLSKLRRYL